ncbi:hypothetical protein Rxycam_03091 [Rubrobacter xylanophilus DSM 9941]|nr:hypothetical protein Rxycam_03091 [Rubrobacter xylanophilus DSM 9941]
MLEVLLHDPGTGESVVLSARGKRADWYRNIEAHPALEVRTGRERYVPEHRVPSEGEAYAALTEYAVRHPVAARVLAAAPGSRAIRPVGDAGLLPAPGCLSQTPRAQSRSMTVAVAIPCPMHITCSPSWPSVASSPWSSFAMSPPPVAPRG